MKGLNMKRAKPKSYRYDEMFFLTNENDASESSESLQLRWLLKPKNTLQLIYT